MSAGNTPSWPLVYAYIGQQHLRLTQGLRCQALFAEGTKSDMISDSPSIYTVWFE